MRAPLVAVLSLPALLAGQEPSQQSAAGSDAVRSQQLPAAIAAYEAHRAKVRAMVEKRLSDVTSHENAARAVARDEFGLSEANLMDPAAFARGVEARLALLQRDDSSAAGFLAAWRAADLSDGGRALRWRLQHISDFATLADTGRVFARELLRAAQRQEDILKGEDNPSKPANVRQAVKRSLDYHEKVIRMVRSRIQLYSEFSEHLRKEGELLNRQFAPLVPTR